MNNIILIICTVILTIGVIANILISQAVSPFFPAITLYKDIDQTIIFLKNIRSSDQFLMQLAYFENLHGPVIREGVFSEDEGRIATIKNLEAVLVKNPKSTDILVNLSQLYRANAQEDVADRYLQEAKSIDPWIK